MKKQLLALLATIALSITARADSSVKITNVHLCCKSCVTGVEKAVAKVQNVTATCDKDAGTVTLTAPDAAAAQGAVDALITAGYFGKSEDAAIKFKDTSGAKNEKVATLTLTEVHLCCGKCVTAVSKALEQVKGITGNTAEKGAKSFEVKGDFNAKEVFTALQNAGLTGKAN